ncbi:hypothetical protein Riv7116_0781 [Rivularia sp. PCC 7116]|uniref:DUF262 domain-containing protein n=1 Tax=Rivularia sp. PCC 7116 TaxID=373994 RepID=UPI00029F44B2|nr:DUF262 domain-containing protein [Rivularia sp. PCC 7116]AFY53368.1 hypothetical protein Riv7116_0781 [Rivularia sp. PCC 7116]
MQVNQISLRRLLDCSVQYQIPLFQRPYSWKEENWEVLWNDLINLYEEQFEGSYFLGPIVTQAVNGTPGSISPYLVIDGQQRLTTLTILLAVVRNHLKKNEPKIAEKIHELYLINKYEEGSKYYKVLPTQSDCQIYQSIVDSYKNIKNLKKEGKIYEAYKFFEKKLKNPGMDLEIEYIQFHNLILERLTLVNITTEDSDNPYLIFESLNNKGEELTQADLIRNYVFMKLPENERDEVYKKQWRPVEEQFHTEIQSPKSKASKVSSSDELTKAIWFYFRRKGDSISEKSVYQELKKCFDRCANHQEFKSELSKLLKFVEYYQRMNFYVVEPEDKLNIRFRRLKRLDFSTCQIFILSIYEKYDDGELSLEEFEAILRYLESYFVRRLFTKVSPSTLGKVFDNLYKEVDKTKSKSILEGLRKVLTNYDKTKIFPDDEAFREGIINTEIYPKTSTYRDRAKLILETLEEHQTKEVVVFDRLQIEHIMPQKLRKEWKTSLGVSHAAIHKKWLHTLGNLTLTGYNPELSNKPFEEKVNLLRESNVTLNRHFHKMDTWNESTIKTRAEDLAKIALKIWVR